MSFRRNIRGGFRRSYYSQQEQYLLNYANATFTRSSEAAFTDPRQGWDFAATGADAWKSTDVPRIFSDGAILIEGARTNLALHSNGISNASWQKFTETTPTIAADQTGPDGDSAYSIDWGTGSIGELRQSIATSDSVVLSASHYLLGIAGSESVQTGLRGKDAAGTLTSRTPGTSGWTRYSDSRDVATGANTPITRLIEVTDGAKFGVAHSGFEVGGFPSSPIRTVAASATRANDVCTIAAVDVPTAMKTGRFTIDFWPAWSSSEIPAAITYLLSANGLSTSYLGIVSSGGTKVRLRSAAGIVDTGAITFSKHQKITITCDHAAGAVTVTGATTGNGTTTNTVTTWTGLTSLSVGNSGGASLAFGVIGRPRAA